MITMMTTILFDPFWTGLAMMALLVGVALAQCAHYSNPKNPSYLSISSSSGKLPTIKSQTSNSNLNNANKDSQQQQQKSSKANNNNNNNNNSSSNNSLSKKVMKIQKSAGGKGLKIVSSTIGGGGSTMSLTGGGKAKGRGSGKQNPTIGVRNLRDGSKINGLKNQQQPLPPPQLSASKGTLTDVIDSSALIFPPLTNKAGKYLGFNSAFGPLCSTTGSNVQSSASDSGSSTGDGTKGNHRLRSKMIRLDSNFTPMSTVTFNLTSSAASPSTFTPNQASNVNKANPPKSATNVVAISSSKTRKVLNTSSPKQQQTHYQSKVINISSGGGGAGAGNLSNCSKLKTLSKSSLIVSSPSSTGN